MSAPPAPLSRVQFNDRRLQLAQFLAKQRGLSYTGLPAEERDLLLDVAGDALRALDDGLVQCWISAAATN